MNGALALADARALLAAGRREFRLLRRYPAAFIGQIFWPVLLPSVWVLMGQAYSGGGDPRAVDAFASRSGTTGVTLFVFVGYAMYMWLSTLLWGPGTSLRRDQMTGTLEAVFLTPASRVVALFGPTLVNVVWTLFHLVVMGLAAFGDARRRQNPWMERLEKVIRTTSDGFELDPTFFKFGGNSYHPRFTDALCCDRVNKR